MPTDRLLRKREEISVPLIVDELSAVVSAVHAGISVVCAQASHLRVTTTDER